MKNLFYTILSTLSLLIVLASCSSVALTGRNRLNMVPDEAILEASFAQYSAFMQKAPISRNQQQTARVRQIGQRIARATDQYLRAAGLAADADKYKWEFNLIASKEVNAFCMPGGKIVVYEGILPVAKNDDQLATVIAHEVAHAVAKHANERMSQQIVRQYGASALSMLLSGKSAVVRQASGIVYDVGTQIFFTLPYSRKHEYEADQIGLYLMAIAGYDYTEAERFWVNMSGGSKKGGDDFMSTHPNDVKRIEAIRNELPKVESFMKGEKKAPKPVNVGAKTVPAESSSLKAVNKNRRVPIKTRY